MEYRYGDGEDNSFFFKKQGIILLVEQESYLSKYLVKQYDSGN